MIECLRTFDLEDKERERERVEHELELSERIFDFSCLIFRIFFFCPSLGCMIFLLSLKSIGDYIF